MSRALTRAAFLACVISTGLLIVSPLMLATAATPQVAEDVLMFDEAWFFRYRQPAEGAPEVPDPSGNEVPAIAKATVRDRTNPYQPETLHVGIVGGEPEAVTFVNFPLYELTPDNAPPVVTGGKITLVDGGSSLGSKRADAAEMVACLAVELAPAAQGGDWKDVPKYDCATKATLQLVEGSEPMTWTIDLAPFTAAWADPSQNFGVAIVPDPDSATPPPDQSWHVSFQAKGWQPPEPSPRDQTSPPPAKAPITADLRFVPVETPDFGGDVDSSGSGGGVSGGSDFSSGSGFSGGFDSADTPDEDTAEAPAVGDFGDDAAPADSGDVVAPPVTRQEQRGVRTNPAVYLLPFLGLGLAGMLGYSLSHDPELPTEREGAVSKLMARRRAGLRD
jgi:hypothetical protein